MAGDASPRVVVRRLIDAVPPTGGAVVMGTGIVSIGLSLDDHETLSRILLALDAMTWLGLGLVLADRAAHDRPRLRREARSPGSLTAAAGSAVLGIRLVLLGGGAAGVALLAIATLLWLLLIAPVLRHWVTPTVGVSFVLVVSTESLAVLSAVVADRELATWLLYAALAPWLVGLGLYAFVLARFDMRQLLVGRGDHWVTGGALAISTLAGARIALAARRLEVLTSLGATLRTLSVVLWALAMAWLPVLLVAEALRPRLTYDVRRWSTVFPVGMYAVCSFITGDAVNSAAMTDFARVWIWVGVAVWLVVLTGMLRRAWHLAR